MRLSYQKIYATVLCGVILFLNIFLWFLVAKGGNNILVVAFLDVGQGDSIFIKAPNNRQVLIDGGPDRGVLTELGNVMPFYDRSINMIIATHPDKDHIGGLVNVFQNFNVDYYIETGFQSHTQVYKTLQGLVEEKNHTVIKATAGTRVHLDEENGIYFDILWPRRDKPLPKESNDTSIVIQLVYGETTFLLTGDASVGVEDSLMRGLGKKILDVDVLKLGHHGSKTSSSEEFLKITTPKIAVVSAGKDNRYGHPSPEIMSRINQLSIPYVETSHFGTIIFKSDGEIISQKNNHPKKR